MATDRFWIALVDVRPDTPDNQEWLDSFGSSNAGAFVHVMGMARSPQDFQDAVVRDLGAQGWTASGFEDLELLSALRTREPLSPRFEQMEQALLKTGELQYGKFFLYPGEDSAGSDWLAREAEDRRLTLTQSAVLANISKMLQQLELPRLDESMGLTGQGSDCIELHLPHVEPEELELTVLVRLDEEITVDYGCGHIHFRPGAGVDWVGQALEFVYGALQGGVQVQIWTDGDRPVRSQPLILLENSEWQRLPMWSATPDPEPSSPPDVVKVLSYLDALELRQEIENTR